MSDQTPRPTPRPTPQLPGVTGEVTEVEYMYRDGANYKQFGVARFAGALSSAQVEAILASCEDGSFLPAQVGMEPLHSLWDSHYDDDHVWHEFVDFTIVTGQAPDGAETAEEFAARFVDITWDVAAAFEALEEFKASTPPGR